MSGGSNATDSKFRPPDYAKPYDISLLQRADQASQQPFQSYGGQRVADFNPQQQQGFNLAGMYGNQGAGVAGAGGQQLYNNLSGANLGGNPYLDQIVNQSNQDISNQYKYATAPGNMAMASRSGSLDNSGVAGKDMMDQYSLAKALSSNESNLRFGNYAQERGYQNAAINPALAYGQQTLGGLSAAGNQQQQQQQAGLDVGFQEFMRQLGDPAEKLNMLQQGIATGQGSFGNQHVGGVQPGPVQIGTTLAGSYLQGK